MECTCSAIIKALGLTSGLAIAGAVQAQSIDVTAPAEFVPTKFSADVNYVSEVVSIDRNAQRGTDPCFDPGIGCPTGGQQNPATNSTISGFGDCGVFDPVDNFVPAVNSNFNSLCWRGDYRNTGTGDDCSPPADADALSGWNFKVYAADTVGLPIGPTPIAEWDSTTAANGGLENATVQRCVTQNTYGDAPGGRPIVLWHADLGIPDGGSTTGLDVDANTCYWLGICWDDDSTGVVDPSCDFRWLLHTDADPNNPAGDGCVAFDNQPAENLYEACDLICSVGDFDWVLNVATVTPSQANNCDSGAINEPPVNESCTNAIALPCDDPQDFCPIFANPNANSRLNPPVNCQSGVAPDVTGEGGFLSHVTWYTFVPTGSVAVVSSCQGENDGWPNTLAVYDPTLETSAFCDAMAANGQAETIPMSEIACSTADCFGDGEACIAGLTPGQTYYIQVGSDDGLNIGSLQMTITCSNVPTPSNDECVDATNLCFGFSGASSQDGDTTCANLDPFAVACGGTVNGLAPGVWYIAQDLGPDDDTFCPGGFIANSPGDGTLWRASTCVSGGGTGFDTEINIYCGQCDCGLVCVAGNDDSTANPDCGGVGGQSEVDWCTVDGETYWVFVHGFFARGAFSLTVTQDVDGAGTCTPDPDTPDCDTAGTECVVGTTDATFVETEACGDQTNQGCTGGVFAGDAEDLGTIDGSTVVVAGQAFGENNFRDLDWYSFTLTERSIVSVTFESEFNGTTSLFDSTNCVTQATIATVATTPCSPDSFDIALNPGSYSLFVSLDDFNGFPCGCQNDYRLDIVAAPVEACCLPDDSCIQTTAADCMARGGDPQGTPYCSSDGEGGVTYTLDEACADTFNSIAFASGATLLDLGLTDGEFVDLPFEMAFFAELYDAVAVTSNGYLGFNDVVALVGTPAAIPDAGDPNNIAAGLWANLDPSTSGDVWVQIDTPTNTAVVEYLEVGRFNAAGPVGENSFQIKLFGDTGCIRYVYGTIDPAPTAGDTVAGLENITGNVGLSVSNVANLGDTGGSNPDEITCVEFCPTVSNPTCEGGVDGDANGDGVVNSGDISYIIFRLGSCDPVPAITVCYNQCDGDANDDGAVNSGDISYVIFRLGTTNPCP